MKSTKERPILFSGEMVRAILDGRKTQTRRIVKPQPIEDAQYDEFLLWHGGKRLLDVWYGADYVHSNQAAVERAMEKTSVYGQPGDRLWVKETFYDSRHESKRCPVTYRASVKPDDDVDRDFAWRPSIFMPRWASRITLEITAVRVERLQSITLSDCANEGAPPTHAKDNVWDSTETYRKLWDSINGKTHSWASNPWVWVIEFKLL